MTTYNWSPRQRGILTVPRPPSTEGGHRCWLPEPEFRWKTWQCWECRTRWNLQPATAYRAAAWLSEPTPIAALQPAEENHV